MLADKELCMVDLKEVVAIIGPLENSTLIEKLNYKLKKKTKKIKWA